MRATARRSSEVLAVADSFLAGPDVVRLLGARARDVEPQFSTPELLELERQVIDEAIALQGAGRGVTDPQVTEAALARRPWLADEQRVMVQRLTRTAMVSPQW